MKEHLFYLQLVNAYAQAGRHEAGASLPINYMYYYFLLLLLLLLLLLSYYIISLIITITMHEAGASLPGLPPVAFHDFFGDRVGVVISALGDLVLQPDETFLEVGVGPGSVALGVLRNSRMRYLGVDPYAFPGGPELFADTAREV